MADFTPQEIEQFLQEFFDVVGARQYVGARYVPIFGRRGEASCEWDDTDAYEPLTIVMHQGNSYTSKTYVPRGVPLTDTEYWVQTGNWNAQVEQYRQEVLTFQSQIDDKVPFPIEPDSRYGTMGQVLSTLQNGLTRWTDPVVPSDEQAEAAVTAWLEQHPEATTTVQDNSITVQKLANDILVDSKLSKLDGVLSSLMRWNAYEIPYRDRQLITESGCTIDSRGKTVSVVGTPSTTVRLNLFEAYVLPPWIPAGSYVWFGAEGLVTGVKVVFFYYTDTYHSLESKATDGETYVQIPTGTTRLLMRIEVDPTFNGIQANVNAYVRTALPQLKTKTEDRLFASLPMRRDVNLNDIHENTAFLIASGGTAQNMPTGRTAGYLVAFGVTSGTWTLQLFGSINDNALYLRVCDGTGTWTTWSRVADYDQTQADIAAAIATAFVNHGAKYSLDLNTWKTSGYFLLAGSANQNAPKQNGLVICYAPTSNWCWQIFVQMNEVKDIYIRRCQGDTWSQWTLIDSGQDVSITNEFNSYANTYNVSATPTITTDTNCYLASSGDSTDRTTDIVTMLTQYGMCNLGPGTFYVSNLVMPSGSTLRGCGYATEVRLAGTGAGFAVQLASDCTLEGLLVRGETAGTSYRGVSTIGNRNGITWVGNYTSSQDEDAQPFNGMIGNVYVENFSGSGIYMYDTGYGTGNGIQLSNVTVDNCVVGLNIAYWSEYSSFDNLKCWHCHWGIINNGGNNIFSNCHLSSNYMGLLMDNQYDDKPNNSHGSMTNCAINHMTDGANGDAISLIGQSNGFVFSNCQMFYGGISVDDCNGIVFAHCNLGGTGVQLDITDGGLVMFSDCVFGSQPTVTKTGTTHVVADGNYTRAGAAVTI